MKYGNRIQALRAEQSLTQEELAQRIDISRAALSHYEKNRREPDYDTLQKLARYFGVTTDYILGRTDDPRPADVIKEQQTSYLYRILGEQLVSPDEMTELPIIGRIAAGEPILAEQNVEGREMVLKSDVVGGEFFWLRVKGDSMANQIADGDLVLVRQQCSLENGQIGVVLVNGDEATIKRVYYKGNQCVLSPENPAYQPQIYPASEVVIIGEVVKSMRRHNGR